MVWVSCHPKSACVWSSLSFAFAWHAWKDEAELLALKPSDVSMLFFSFFRLRNLYAGLEVTVRTGHGTTDWFKIAKRVHQGCILSPCFFNLYEEYIKWNAGLNEAQTGVKIGGENINNLRYADDTTLRAESKEELKNLLMKLKEESEKAGLKFNIQKAKIMASGPITSW